MDSGELAGFLKDDLLLYFLYFLYISPDQDLRQSSCFSEKAVLRNVLIFLLNLGFEMGMIPKIKLTETTNCDKTIHFQIQPWTYGVTPIFGAEQLFCEQEMFVHNIIAASSWRVYGRKCFSVESPYYSDSIAPTHMKGSFKPGCLIIEKRPFKF